MNIIKQFQKLKPEQQLLLVIAIVVLLSSLFWRTGADPFSIGASAHIGNLKGSVQLEAFENDGEYIGDDEYIHRNKHFVLFYVPWCGYCKNVLPIWDQLSQKFSDRENVKIMKVNCEKFTNMANKHGVDSYPTIKFFPNGINDTKNYINYVDSRDLSSFIRFLEKHSEGRDQYQGMETFQNANTYSAPVGYNEYEIFEPFAQDTRDDEEPNVRNASGTPDDWYLQHMVGGRAQAMVNRGPMRDM